MAAAPSSSNVTIVDAPPPKPPPAPTSSISVSQMGQMATTPTTTKRGSAMERTMQALRQKAGATDSEPSPPVTPDEKAPRKAAVQPTTAADSDQGEGEELVSTSPSPDSSESQQGDTQTSPTTDEKQAGKPESKGKASPWKVVDQYKSQNTKLQKEIADLRAQITPETDRKALMERTEKAEKLAKTLADEIRFAAYEKSPEFKEQFHAPYEATFRRALEDLSEVTITDSDSGQVRQLTGDDLAQFAFMSFSKAKQAANNLFPDFAEDIMAARKDIRAAWDKRQAALNEWKEKGSQREQQQREAYQKQASEVEGFIRQTWERANSEVTSDERHGALFKPVEGDAEWNARLERGFALVDKAYAENPASPNLSPAQRAEAVKRHAAVRARAAGWGALRYRNEQLNKKIADLEKELSQFKSSTPTTGGKEAAPSKPSGPQKASDRVFAKLREMAH